MTDDMQPQSPDQPAAPELTIEQRAAFDEIFRTFASPGWQLLKRELLSQQAVLADVRRSNNLEFSKGQLNVLDPLCNWETMWEHIYAGALDGSITVSPEFGNAPSV